jgi:uncharacterized damage-inducible protein DinB
MRADFDTLFAYSDNCRRLLYETLLSYPESFDASVETISQWSTIRLLLAHCIGAEERLVSTRIQGKTLSASYEERAATTIEELFADADTIRDRTNAYRRTLTDADYDTPLSASSPPWNNLTISDVLFQVFNHENYHRGQIIMILQSMRIDPPNFDFILLKP